MNSVFNKVLLYICTFFILLQSLCGCSTDKTIENNDNTIKQDTIQQDVINQDELEQDVIIEPTVSQTIICDDSIMEDILEQDIITQSYIIEMTVGSTSNEELSQYLPEELADYDINWPLVIGEFAVGTTIMIVVGAVNYKLTGNIAGKIPGNETAYYVFVSPITVAKDAILYGIKGAILDTTINYLSKGKLPEEAIKKYSIEGFAHGYMVGAISSVLKVTKQNLKKSKLSGLGEEYSVALDGSVRDSLGKTIGKVCVQRDGKTAIIDSANNVIKMFDANGVELFGESLIQSLPPRQMVAIGEEIARTDDNGKIFRVGNELTPNSNYCLNGYNYIVDSNGNICEVSGNLKLKPNRARLDIEDSLNVISKGSAKLGDDRGHLIADRFDGNNTLANIVPMNQELNRGSYKELEDIWGEALKENKSVEVNIKLNYGDLGSSRPSEFEIIYKIAGEVFKTILTNL